MEFKDVVYKRKSIRGYTNEPVSREVLKDILTVASQAVSGENTQPWEFVVVTGETLDELRARNVELLRSGAEPDRADAGVPAEYKDRARTIGKALLGAMNIAREDKEGRRWWAERGFRFFDAPVAIFLMMDTAFDETAYRFDMGCVAQNICLAAVEHGLGTCVEDQAVMYQTAARELLGIPENKRFVVGIAIGYPDEAFAANRVKSTREDVDNITVWHGF